VRLPRLFVTFSTFVTLNVVKAFRVTVSLIDPANISQCYEGVLCGVFPSEKCLNKLPALILYSSRKRHSLSGCNPGITTNIETSDIRPVVYQGAQHMPRQHMKINVKDTTITRRLGDSDASVARLALPSPGKITSEMWFGGMQMSPPSPVKRPKPNLTLWLGGSNKFTRLSLYTNTPLHDFDTTTVTHPPQVVTCINDHRLLPLPFLPVPEHRGQCRLLRRSYSDTAPWHRTH